MGDNNKENFSQEKAEFFEALGHPTRIKILKILEKSHLGFSDIKNELEIESSGLVQFHLGKLQGLIKSTDGGKYALTDEGKEALRIVFTMEDSGPILKRKISITPQQIVSVLLICGILIVSTLLYFENQNMHNELNTTNQILLDLNHNYTDLAQKYDNLLRLSTLLMNVNLHSSISPPISKISAMLIALDYGQWTHESLRGMNVGATLYYMVFQENPDLGGGVLYEVTQPVSNYSPTQNGTATYRYIWIVTVQSQDVFQSPPPGFYFVDASNGAIIPTGLLI